jgi:hypothetical protein
MNKKIIAVASIVVVFALGFLYLNQGYLIASDKDGNTCSSSCDDKGKNSGTSSIKAGSDWSVYEFTTDKACCEQMKSDLQKDLGSVAGVKEVKFSQTCNVSKMTNVSVYYAAGETSEDAISSLVKNKSYDCSTKCEGKSGCDKKSNDTKLDAGKEGCDPNKECPGKNKKSGDSKQL